MPTDVSKHLFLAKVSEKSYLTIGNRKIYVRENIYRIVYVRQFFNHREGAAPVACRAPDEKRALIVPQRGRGTATVALGVLLAVKEVVAFRECRPRGGIFTDAHAEGAGEDRVF